MDCRPYRDSVREKERLRWTEREAEAEAEADADAADGERCGGGGGGGGAGDDERVTIVGGGESVEREGIYHDNMVLEFSCCASRGLSYAC
ncbi:hypothetical protein Sjap_023320 [Stephania japonica]|uniref:Uncharacterized protein n=1 Tax=Stephania japonica TaxID=461633 RepID=A0AAP0EIM5_9MAGN